MPDTLRRHRVGVRVASALSAAVVVAVALVVAGAALVYLVGQSLGGTVEATAEERAAQIAQRVEGNYKGSANENAREALEILTTDDDLAQVLITYPSDSGNSRAIVIEGGTSAAGRDQALTDVRPPAEGTLVEPRLPVRRADGSTVEAVVVVVSAGSVGLAADVIVAMPLTEVDAATDTVLFYLLFGVPILILVAGAATYLFAGRALRPVEAIRRQVAAMTEKDLARRVPVPASRDEVGRLAETMNAMIARLEDAQGVQRRFVADASHELRSPLATIATGLELLQRDTGDPGTVTTLRAETERVNRLVDALLLLARADERGLQPRREEVDLDEIAEAEHARPTEGGVRTEVRAEPVRIIGDRGQLVRVLRNLVDNGRRHARSGVLVTVARDGSDAVLEVCDDGPGVPPADRDRIFERFVRLDDARSRSDGGSGLGLAIVAEVVAAHGGSVELEDTPGGGALFRVRLPASTEPPPVEEPGRGEPPTVAHRIPDRSRAPVTDEEARVDPVTAPWGIPRIDDAPATDPSGRPALGSPATDPNGMPAAGPSQAGSAIR